MGELRTPGISLFSFPEVPKDEWDYGDCRVRKDPEAKRE